MAQIQEQAVPTDFKLAKKEKKQDASDQIARHRSTIDLKKTRSMLSRLQDKFRKA